MAESNIPTSDTIFKDFKYQLQRLTTLADELDILIFKMGQIHNVLSRGCGKE
ncbi:MAG TPA: hypothetical protein VMW10_05265 [Alphaproteobacteria bacterium]|nr:hypothetical protein [Alphaproteobacteria bacterium]